MTSITLAPLFPNGFPLPLFRSSMFGNGSAEEGLVPRFHSPAQYNEMAPRTKKYSPEPVFQTVERVT